MVLEKRTGNRVMVEDMKSYRAGGHCLSPAREMKLVNQATDEPVQPQPDVVDDVNKLSQLTPSVE